MSKYEKRDTEKTKATFALDDVALFMEMGSHFRDKRLAYLKKVAQRPPNPRLQDGMETLDPITTLADVDMSPLSTKANLARFMSKHPSFLEGEDGYDTDSDDPHDFDNISDRAENPPSVHETRTVRLKAKLKDGLKALQDEQEARKNPPATTLPEPVAERPQKAGEAKGDPAQ